MPLWRWTLLGVTTVAILAWTALLIPELFRGFTADCAQASSEVSDPCAFGVGLWTVATVGIWLAGIAVLGAAWAGLW